MPPILILMVLGVAGWAWWTGRLKGFTFEDGAALFIALLGLRFLTTGRLVIGVAMIGVAVALSGGARWQRRRSGLSLAEARALLGVGGDASLDQIRDAHRRRITEAHPDAGGSTEAAQRINEARDMLVAQLNRNPPRAS